MGQQFLGQIQAFSFGFPPKGWALCNGQLLAIQQNLALFSLLGTQYGGNGSTNFALPDLRGRVPLSMGQTLIGTPGGEAAHTLTISEMAGHPHTARASSQNGNSPLGANNVLGQALNLYRGADTLTIVHPNTVSLVGNGQPHENMAPYLTLSYCIALQGIFPSRN